MWMGALKRRWLCFAGMILTMAGSAGAADHPQGVAGKYVGDAGIAEDPNVVFAENFEAGSLEVVTARWESAQNASILSLSDEVPEASGGELNLNYLWLLCYTTKAPTGHVSTVWFDDLVVAREYVGPITRPRAR